MSHKNFKDLRKAVLLKAKEGLRKDVMPYVKMHMTQAIQEEVYDVYSPRRYERRGYNDGLLDSDNIIGIPLHSNRHTGFDFEIYNDTKTNFDGRPQTYLTPLVVLGQKKAKSLGFSSGYLYYPDSEDEPYAQERDFISATKRKIDKGIVNILLKGYMNNE